MSEHFGEFDFIVVGAGTAGCVLANRLSADPAARVLLLEAGGRDNYLWIKIPIGYLYTMMNPRTDWRYRTEPAAGLGGRSLDYPRGRTLGGCSAINGMIYMRGQAADYDRWRALGNVGWGWDDVLPLFIRNEDYHRGGGEFHGAGGPLRVEKMRVSWPILDSCLDAAREAGHPIIDDFNRGDNRGFAYFEVNQRRGVRQTAAAGALAPVYHRKNLAVLTDAHAVAVVFEEQRAAAVDFIRGGRGGARKRARARAEVILAAGAINSPHLLQLSGVGPAALLREHGVALVCDAPQVGENLHDHLQIRPVFSVQNAVTANTLANSVFGRARMGLEYLLRRSGPLAGAPSQMGGFVKSAPDALHADLQFHIQPLSTAKLGGGGRNFGLDPFNAITLSVCNLQPKSRGFVRLRDADPFSPPQIQPNYLEQEEDRLVAARAIRAARQIASQPALARRHNAAELRPGTQFQSDEELAREAGAIANSIFHPVDTCRMGADDAAVVTPRLQVRGVAGLRIADAGIMPQITSGNTNAPASMIAEKAAEMIIADNR